MVTPSGVTLPRSLAPPAKLGEGDSLRNVDVLGESPPAEGTLGVGSLRPWADRLKAPEGRVEQEVSCPDVDAWLAALGSEHTGFRHPGFTESELENLFSVSTTADKKSCQ